MSGENPVALVIFGASGDLTRRKLVPALWSLFSDGLLPTPFVVIGMARTPLSEEDFRKRMEEGVRRFSRHSISSPETWSTFIRNFHYLHADYGDPEAYRKLREELEKLDQTWKTRGIRIFYMATPPDPFPTVAENLHGAGLCRDRDRTRVVVEKPFGRDLESAKALNRLLASYFRESQIYRIDHYLGKETVQNIMALRFANAIFEPIWDRRYVDHVQITVAESEGVGHRARYYDKAGALRDMVQNHLLQVLCLIAMEPPVTLQGEEVRNKRVEVLRAIRPIPKDRVQEFAARGQYGAGWIEGKRVPAYREEEGVDPQSNTETFAALKLFIDNWRWQGVPFYLRTGKRLPARASEVSIIFRPAPHQPFPRSASLNWKFNRLAVRIQPEEGIVLRFLAKEPGQLYRLRPAEMRFTYRESFGPLQIPEAYETLLLDVIHGDPTLFMRADQVEAAWEVVMPVLEVWSEVPPPDFPNYPAGGWGPEEAETLIARDGRSWLTPTVLEEALRRSP